VLQVRRRQREVCSLESRRVAGATTSEGGLQPGDVLQVRRRQREVCSLETCWSQPTTSTWATCHMTRPERSSGRFQTDTFDSPFTGRCRHRSQRMAKADKRTRPHNECSIKTRVFDLVSFSHRASLQMNSKLPCRDITTT